jgi:predicted dehydrogenase
MMREFLDGLSRGSAPRVTLQDGIDVLQTALAAKKSIQTHQKVSL